MSMRIRTHGVFLSYELEYFVRTKVNRALNRFLVSVQAVDVLLAVENGTSRVCRLSVHLEHGAKTIGAGAHRDIEGAVCLAVEKLSRSVARFCRRQRSRRRDVEPQSIDECEAR